ncbi:Os04g0518532 [Oryza sativa Japonica Group]|uniref:Os04g0518532 protein n=1 Tax=Oryza sativa subsp. japonica TaxID=39947 RepID=A0A0N7KJD4_ORYSJ|nr:Os04g0518532 [Oryza sativa Japonica Group]
MQNMQQCRLLRVAVEGVAGEPDRPQCSEVSAHPCSRRRQDTGSDAERCMWHARSASSGWWPATVRTLSCGHDFHEDCNIAKWLRDNKKACPVHSACNIQFHRTMSTNGGLEHLDSLFAANSLVYCRVYAKAFALAPRQLVKSCTVPIHVASKHLIPKSLSRSYGRRRRPNATASLELRHRTSPAAIAHFLANPSRPPHPHTTLVHSQLPIPPTSPPFAGTR